MQKRVTTSSTTKSTAGKSLDRMAKMGNGGNTKGTRLPGGGKPKGVKKSSRGGY